MNEEEVNKILGDGVSDGLFEIADEADGTPENTKFKLTGYGNYEAQRTIAEEGLPFMIFVMAKLGTNGKLEDNPTVKEMANLVVKDLPPKLRKTAKQNFPFMWKELADMRADEYAKQYRELEDNDQHHP